MTRYADLIADAWAEFWGTLDAGALSRIYARDVVWWDVALGRGSETRGHDGVSATRAHHHDVAPGREVFVVRVVPGDVWIAVEFVTVARDGGARVGVPGCAWIRVDDDGRIVREHWYWEWARRRAVDETLAGRTVAGGGDDRGPRWYRDFAARLMETWDDDPEAMVESFYAPEVRFDTMGAGPERGFRGAPALQEAERVLAAVLVERTTKIAEVAGSGPLVAFTHFTEARTETGPRRVTPAARVLTIDEYDRVVGDHTYLVRAWPARGPRDPER